MYTRGLPGHGDNWRGYTAASVVNSAADVRDNSLMVRPEYCAVIGGCCEYCAVIGGCREY